MILPLAVSGDRIDMIVSLGKGIGMFILVMGLLYGVLLLTRIIAEKINKR